MITKVKTAKRKCASQKPSAEKWRAKSGYCRICGEPATRSVDGEPSCDEHVEQVYERQAGDYTVHNLGEEEWRRN